MPTADKEANVFADVPELMVSVSTPEVVKEEPAAVPLRDTVAASAVPATAAVAVPTQLELGALPPAAASVAAHTPNQTSVASSTPGSAS
jgi:hypothetical protein